MHLKTNTEKCITHSYYDKIFHQPLSISSSPAECKSILHLIYETSKFVFVIEINCNYYNKKIR